MFHLSPGPGGRPPNNDIKTVSSFTSHVFRAWWRSTGLPTLHNLRHITPYWPMTQQFAAGRNGKALSYKSWQRLQHRNSAATTRPATSVRDVKNASSSQAVSVCMQFKLKIHLSQNAHRNPSFLCFVCVWKRKPLKVNVNCSCLHHKGVWREYGYNSTHTSRYTETSGQLQAPAASPPGKTALR